MQNSNNSLIAVVTGASSGIGKELIKTLNQKGYKIVCVSRNKPDVDFDCDFFECDLSVPEQTKITAEKITDKYKKIDLVINNAGLGVSGATELIPEESIRYVLEVDYFAPLLFTRGLLPSMQKGSKIVFISSACALFALPYRNVYCSAKAAVNMLSYGLRMELKPAGITVSTICPGDIHTGFTANRLKYTNSNERYDNRVLNAQNKVDGRENKRMNVVKASKKIADIATCGKRALYIIGAKYKLLHFVSRFTSQNLYTKIVGKMFN